MRDSDCIAFLQWALPKMGMRWPGFRKVRRQVCKRLSRRLGELGLDTLEQYRQRLDTDPDEWAVLDAACRITISRFYRDKHVFGVLGRDVLPALAQRARENGRSVQVWCAGCASGEEVYSLAILWDAHVRPAYSDVDFEVVGTDAEPVMVARAERACFTKGSFKDMPAEWLDKAFERSNGTYCVASAYRRHVTLLCQDIRQEMPGGPFDLVLCRNLAFTYFAPETQRSVLKQIKARLKPMGYLVIGAHENLPETEGGFEALTACREIFRYRGKN